MKQHLNWQWGIKMGMVNLTLPFHKEWRLIPWITIYFLKLKELPPFGRLWGIKYKGFFFDQGLNLMIPKKPEGKWYYGFGRAN
jgi:hypothetical protein